MFLAQPIISGIVINYKSLGDIPHTLQTNNCPLYRDVSKNPENPITEYHTWMNEHGNTYDRAAIINQFKNNNKKFHIDTRARNITTDETKTRTEPLDYSTRCDKLFTLLAGMAWCDKDVAIKTIDSVNRINMNTLQELIPTMKQLAEELKIEINKCTAALESLDEENQYNFLFHIIAKGQQYYNSCCIDPEFCTFIIPMRNYQNLFTMIKQSYGVINNDNW